MSRLEILNSGSLRIDGRRTSELRSLVLQIAPEASVSAAGQGTATFADGSARVDQGLTTVHAAVFGPREAKTRSSTQHDRAILDVDVSLEPWSGRERRKRVRGDR